MRRIFRSVVLTGFVAAMSACGTNSEDAPTGEAASAVVGQDTFLYLRCNATSWNVDSSTRLQPGATEGTLTLTYDVEQDWQVVRDNCVITETNAQDGWGTTQSSYLPNGSTAIVAPTNGTLQPGGHEDHFAISYPKRGKYTLTVNVPGQTFEVAPAYGQLKGGTVYASAYNSPEQERIVNAFDDNPETKWLIFEQTGYLQYDSPKGEAYIVTRYGITSANDYSERDPRDFTLLGSNDGFEWTVIDERTEQTFDDRFFEKDYEVQNTKAFNKYRLVINKNSGGEQIQLSEFKLWGTPGTPATAPQPVITASSESSGQEAAKAFDSLLHTKWVASESSPWIRYEFPKAVTIDGYALSSANDSSSHDPKNWTLEGSSDGTSWVVLDTRSNQRFINRYNRNHYFIDNSTPYKHYRFTLASNESPVEVSEIEFLRTDDPFRALIPSTVTLADNTTLPHEHLFEQAMGATLEKDVKEISRKIVQELYAQPGAFWSHKKAIHIELNDTGIAGTGGDLTQSTVGFGVQFLQELHDGGTDVRFAVTGMLYHELGHVFQYDDVGPNNGYIIEGLADAMRLRTGYHDLTVRQIGPFARNDGDMATFLLWMDQYKMPGFFAAYNAALSPFDATTYDEQIFVTLTGQTRDQLWTECMQRSWW